MASVYRDAAEAVIVEVSPGGSGGGFDDVGNEQDDPGTCRDMDPEERAARDAANLERSNRRARSGSRRYMVANRLRYQIVLTFESAHYGCDGRVECMRAVAAFAIRLRDQFGVMPYWYSPELHPGGHGWHVNFMVPKRLPHAVVQPLWGHGHVWMSDKLKHPKVASLNLPFVEAMRLAALYACKYAVKDWDPEMIGTRRHRYECAQQFEPERIIGRAETLEAMVEWVQATYGIQASVVTRSSDIEGWDGPLAYFFRWAAPSKFCEGIGGGGGPDG